MRSVSLITASRYSVALAGLDLGGQPLELAPGGAAAGRTPTRAWSRSSRGRRPAASSARRAAPGRSSAGRPRRAPGAGSTARRRARLDVRRLPAARDLVVDLGVRRGPQPQEALPDPAPDGLPHAAGSRSPASARLCMPMSSIAPSRSRSRASRSASSMPKTVRMMISSVIAWVRGRRPNGCPTGQRSISPLRDLLHQVAVALHPLAVERGQHQLALAHVLGAVEQQHRVAPHQRLERSGVRLARVQHVRVAPEDLLDHAAGRRRTRSARSRTAA